jgi:hypothetical protein
VPKNVLVAKVVEAAGVEDGNIFFAQSPQVKPFVVSQ